MIESYMGLKIIISQCRIPNLQYMCCAFDNEVVLCVLLMQSLVLRAEV